MENTFPAYLGIRFYLEPPFQPRRQLCFGASLVHVVTGEPVLPVDVWNPEHLAVPMATVAVRVAFPKGHIGVTDPVNVTAPVRGIGPLARRQMHRIRIVRHASRSVRRCIVVAPSMVPVVTAQTMHII